MKRRVNDEVIDNVAYYIEKRYRPVDDMLAEARRVLTNPKAIIGSCITCQIPYDKRESLPDSSLECYECSSVYACGKSFCKGPFKVVKCDGKGCNSMFCNNEAHSLRPGCGQSCLQNGCKVVMCSTCTNECGLCGMFFCKKHLIHCGKCGINVCFDEWEGRCPECTTFCMGQRCHEYKPKNEMQTCETCGQDNVCRECGATCKDCDQFYCLDCGQCRCEKYEHKTRV